MSKGGRRKLSFVGLDPQGNGDNQLNLDSEMERVFWNAKIQAAIDEYNQENNTMNDVSEISSEIAPIPLNSLTPTEQDGSPVTNLTPAHIEQRETPRKTGRVVYFEDDRFPPTGLYGDNWEDTSTRRRVHVNRRDGTNDIADILPDETYQKLYDRRPHSVFVQLDELLTADDGETKWLETARWIKYEEDVEKGSHRWGRPHVASLSFHSLLNLRRCLETGLVLLDLDENDLFGVVNRVIEAMVADRLLEEDDKNIVIDSLLKQHKHVQDERFRFMIRGRRPSNATSSTESKRRQSSFASPPNYDENGKKPSSPVHERTETENSPPLSASDSPDESRRANHDTIMKRIPDDAEATSVLVGAVDFLDQPIIAFVRLAQGILMPTVTEVPIPVRFMFILLGPRESELDYHEIGRSISTLMSHPSFHPIAYQTVDRGELLSGINQFLDDSIVLPPGDWERQALVPFEEIRAKSEMIRRRKLEARNKVASVQEERINLFTEKSKGPPGEPPEDPLSKTGRLFGGVIRDIKRRYPFYVSDFRDALNGQCAAATIFMYFAALSSAITFGGLLAEKTYGDIGISETLVFTCVGGILFALLAGQPMMITGATGPLLLLDESLAKFCHTHDIDFLSARMFCGLWMIVIAVLVASFEGSVAVKMITRFTQDIFAFLISLIFISEPVTNLIALYSAHPLGYDYCQSLNTTELATNNTANMDSSIDVKNPPQPNTALFCTILTIVTFLIAYYLRIFRNGKYLGRSVRRALGDFGVPIAIILMVGLSVSVPVWTEKLQVPDGLSPTADRSWFVPLNPGFQTIPVWVGFVMVLPAFMIYIIVFMETHIAELIIDKPERRLKKGSGFHLDIVIMSIVNAVCGMFGAPWQCVATVRSVSHVSALTIMSTTHAPGDKPHIDEVKEQRLTGLLVAVLVGISVLAASCLRMVPMAVLFGVFLYMGISALGGIQFWDRCILILKPVKHHPQAPYVRRVPTLKMHLYTLIQIVAVCGLYAIKSSKISLGLPFFLVLMVPLRMVLVFIFTPLQLRALDGAQGEIEKDDEPDFYEQSRLPG